MKSSPQTDSFSRPDHYYAAGGMELQDVLCAKLSPEQYEGFLRGNVIKYLLRYPLKGTPGTDLEKARVYLRWLIEHREVKP